VEQSRDLNVFRDALEALRARGLLRARAAHEGLPGKRIVREGRSCLNLSSNDYLGLANHPKVRQAAADAALAHGAGSGGSRLLGGGLPIHRELEEAVARLRPLGKALLFNTGFMANQGTLQALAPLVGPIYSDKLNHASVAEALRTIPGSYHRYRHGDMTHLESLLEKRLGAATGAPGVRGPGLVISETLFSMDGDVAPLEALLALQARYGFLLYLDEAHSTGCRPDLFDRARRGSLTGRLLIMGTFGKAYGGFGAYLAGPDDVIEYLVNAARSFIFSTALPPAAAGAALAALEVAEAEPWRREKLADLAASARDRLRGRGFDLGRSESHIIPVMAGSNADAAAFSRALFREGFHAPPVRHPTVPEGTARLRLSLTSGMEDGEMEALADALERARDAIRAGKADDHG
jgi:8-amino-7-oxononanoate synthase